jgi:hypothetical protein
MQRSRKKQLTTYQEHFQVRGSAVNGSPREILSQLERKRAIRSNAFEISDVQS